MTLRFRYECGAASLRYRYRNCAKITVLMSEPRAILALGSDIKNGDFGAVSVSEQNSYQVLYGFRVGAKAVRYSVNIA